MPFPKRNGRRRNNKIPGLFIRRRGTRRISRSNLETRHSANSGGGTEKSARSHKAPFGNSSGAVRVHPQQKSPSRFRRPRRSRRSIKKLRSRQVHAQTLTTAELRLHTLIHPTKITQRGFHQEWWKAVPSSAVIGEVTGCFSKKASMRLKSSRNRSARSLEKPWRTITRITTVS